MKTTTLNQLSFVRFFLTTDNNNNVLEFPEIRTGAQGLTNYEKDNVLQLKIPVTLSYPKLKEEITVSYSATIDGTLNADLSPEKFCFLSIQTSLSTRFM